MAALTPVEPASSFVHRALGMLEKTGWKRQAGRRRTGFCFQRCGCICWDGVYLTVRMAVTPRSLALPARQSHAHTPLNFNDFRFLFTGLGQEDVFRLQVAMDEV